MDKLRHKEYDFGSKLRQASVIDRLKDYISWFRAIQHFPSGNPLPLPSYSPVSINLDLTSSCNFACPHCVDSGIINTSKHLEFKTIKQTVDTLHGKGLLAIILIGGGEPTLHKNFEEIVRYIKSKGLQLGIVTNGSRLSKVAAIADLLGNEDWLRLSLDAGTEKIGQRPSRGYHGHDVALPFHRDVDEDASGAVPRVTERRVQAFSIIDKAPFEVVCLGQFDKIWIARQIDGRITAIVKQLLPLAHHAQVAIIHDDDDNLGF